MTRSQILLSSLTVFVAVSSCTEITRTSALNSPVTLKDGTLEPGAEGRFAIDLETTLQLAAGRNLDLAMAVEKANRAAARSDQAALSILPDIAAGASYAGQDGLLQEIGGAPIETERVNHSAGLGTSSGVPGIGMNLSLSRALFEPLAARQDRNATASAAKAKEHQVLADAATAYFELVRARAAHQLAYEIEGASAKLAESTRAFANAGEGLQADSERAMATHLLRKGQTARTEADVVIRSSTLARLLHLPVSLTLVPTDESVAATHLVDPDEPAARMVATALRFRPETAEMQAEVSAATNRLVEQKVKPFLPNVAASYSNFEFAAGRGVGTDADDSREEVAALIYWKLEGLGLGNAAATREKKADLDLMRLAEARTLDTISSEVVSSRATVLAQRKRLSLGGEAATHAQKAYELTAARLQQSQGLPIEALASIQTLAEARQAEIDAVLDYNIAQHRLFAALGHPK